MGLGESSPLRDFKGPCEVIGCNMTFRLHQEEASSRFERVMDLPKHFFLVGDFVDHPESKGKFKFSFEIKSGGLDLVQGDP